MAIQDTNLQSNRQHAVPQNIMDVEFKIIGDLTMRQFSYLMILGILAYVNMQFMVGIFKWPLTLFFGLLGLGLAFVPVQDRGLDVWLVNFIKSVYSPTQRVWRKTLAVPSAFLYDNLNVVKQELITLAPTSSRRKLEEYLDYSSKTLPRDPLDIPETEYIMKVRQMYSSSLATAASQVATSSREEDMAAISPKQVSEFISKEPPKQVITTPAVPSGESPKGGLGSLVSKFESNIGTAMKDISNITKEVGVSVTSMIKSKEEVPQEKPTPPSAIKSVDVKAVSPVVEVSSIVSEKPKEVTKIKEPPVEVTPSRVSTEERSTFRQQLTSMRAPTPVVPRSVPTAPVFASITPDRHSGRKFVSFLPAQGELVLPIRGERVLKTSDQLKIEENLEEKTEQLQQLLSQIRQSNVSVETPKKVVNNNAPISSNVGMPVGSKVTNITNKNENLDIDKASTGKFSVDSGSIRLDKDIQEDVRNVSSKVASKPKEDISDISGKFKVSVEPLTAKISSQRETSSSKAIAEVSDEVLNVLTKKRESIINELSSLRSSDTATSKEKILNLQKTLQQVNAQYQQVKKELQNIGYTSEAVGKVEGSGLPPKQSVASPTLTFNTSTSFSKPNILWGFVKDSIGKPMVDTVVIVKNSRGEPVRALKTNALGQFTLTTPLNNGKYTVEVSSSNKLGLSFDTLSLEASGNVIPSMEFIGR